MKRWQYKVLEVEFTKNNLEDIENKLNTLGLEGWQVVSAPLHSLNGTVNYVSTAFVLQKEVEA